MEIVQFQSFVFLYSVYGGILIGISYDIYRVIRGRNKSEKLIASVWDILFIFSVFTVIIWVVFSSSYGEIRPYVLIGFLVGFFLYEKLLGRIAAGLFCFLYRKISIFLKKTNCILVLPIKLLYFFIYRCCHNLWDMLKRGKNRLRKIGRLPKQIIEDAGKYYFMIIKRKKL